MPIGILIGLGGGLASTLLLYSASRGSPALSAILLLLTPLPSLLAGLGWGSRAALAAAVSGGLAMLAISGFLPALGALLTLGAPVALVSHLVYLSRPLAGDPTVREWYPAGRLLSGIALFGGALPVLMLPLIGGTYEILRAPLSEFIRRLSVEAANDMGLKPLGQEQVESFAELMVAALPGMIASYWTVVFVLNVYLAARIAYASGLLARDWPDIPGLAFPVGLLLIAALAAAATLGPGAIGVAGVGLMGSLLVAFMLCGLTLMHNLARRRAPALVIFVYVALVIFGPYVAAMLILCGMADTLFNLKGRFGGPPPPK